MFAGIDVAKVLPELLRRCQQRRLAEKRGIVMEHFRKALWNDLFANHLAGESPGEVAKELCALAGEYFTVRVTFAMVDAVARTTVPMSEQIATVFEEYRRHLCSREISVDDYFYKLEMQRAIAVEFSERKGTDVDHATVNAILAADCYLVAGNFDGQGVSVFCAKAFHILWRAMGSDRFHFLREAAHQLIESIDA